MQNNIWLRWLEAVSLTIVAILLAAFFSPSDPLLLQATFPWIWFLPALMGLRHGRVAALLSSAIIVAVLIYTMYAGYFTWDDYRLWLLGGITLAVICGEYHAFWGRRQFRIVRKEKYLAKRIEELSISYGVVRLSHDRLEEALIVKPTTLREAFIELQNLLKECHGHLNEIILKKFLEILSFYTGIDKVSLYILDQKKSAVKISAHLHDNNELDWDDPLVKNCLTNHVASYYAVNLLDENQNSKYLVVMPLKTSDESLLGFVTIKEMSFLSLNEETLKTITLLLSYFANEEKAAGQALTLQKIFPNCPSLFCAEAYKLEQIWKIAGLDTAIAVFYFQPHPKQEDIYYLIKQQKRALDIIWETEIKGSKVLIILMPLTERSMFRGYLQRIQDLVKQESKLTLGEGPIFIRHYQLSAYKNIIPLLEDAFKYDTV